MSSNKEMDVDESIVENNSSHSSMEVDQNHNVGKKLTSDKKFATFMKKIEDIITSLKNHKDKIQKTPKFIKKALLRDYQIKGVNFLISLYENNLNGILADEMGLGKTIQTITFLGYLRHYKDIEGPHLVIAPLSTLQNWINEFNRFCPSIKAICLIGSKSTRAEFRRDVMNAKEWNVCVTSYEICILDKAFLKKIKWKTLTVDEGHRIKSEHTMLAKILRTFHTDCRLLLTGTPLHNNLHEMWSLLNYLMSDVFHSHYDFDTWFNTQEVLKDHDKGKFMHKVMEAIMLRRVKCEVEKSLLAIKESKVFAELTDLQRIWLKRIVIKDIPTINSLGQMSMKRLNHISMEIRKCTNHPYLVEGAEPEDTRFSSITDERIVQDCGKMVLLDKILQRLKTEGSRVLLFTQFLGMLDIFEDYCVMRNYNYCRLDGSTKHEDRTKMIDEYNAKNSKIFIFMLSTRAGGLGINLATADSVVIYDSDWNPQQDLQAISRSHRIGQTKQVRVFRLITKNSVDERIAQIAEFKLSLDKVVIRKEAPLLVTEEEILEILHYGMENQFKELQDPNSADEYIASIMDSMK